MAEKEIKNEQKTVKIEAKISVVDDGSSPENSVTTSDNDVLSSQDNLEEAEKTASGYDSNDDNKGGISGKQAMANLAVTFAEEVGNDLLNLVTYEVDKSLMLSDDYISQRNLSIAKAKNFY